MNNAAANTNARRFAQAVKHYNSLCPAGNEIDITEEQILAIRSELDADLQYSCDMALRGHADEIKRVQRAIEAYQMG